MDPLEFKLGTYTHYKGGTYRAHYIAYLESTLEPHVVYEMLYDSPLFPRGTMWVRPLSVFLEQVTLADGQAVPRFRLAEEGSTL